MPDADAGRDPKKTAGRPTGAGHTILAACRSAVPVCADRAFPAVSYSIGINAGDAARRRLAVCVQILLRLQPLFAPAFVAAVFRTNSGLGTAARRHCGIPASAR